MLGARGERADRRFALCVRQWTELRGYAARDGRGLAARLEAREVRTIAPRERTAQADAGIDGGVLANSAAAEALTSVLIGINRRYKVPGAGIRITGLAAKSVA